MANSPREQGETDMILGTTKTARAGVGTPCGSDLTPESAEAPVNDTEPCPSGIDQAEGDRLLHYAHRILAWCRDDKATRITLGSIISDMLREAGAKV